MPAHLHRAYRAAEYRVGAVRLRIGRRSAALDGLFGVWGRRVAVLLTAWNPRSRRRPEGINTRMMDRLGTWLRRVAVTPAESGEGRWRETQLCAACAPAWAARLARRFGQAAIVVLRAGQAPRLLPLV